MERKDNAQVSSYVFTIQNASECDYKRQDIHSRKERRMTEIIIKVDDKFLEFAKMGGMEDQYELIRCEDCKHYDIQVQQCTCEADWFGIEPNGFCSRAERKEE